MAYQCLACSHVQWLINALHAVMFNGLSMPCMQSCSMAYQCLACGHVLWLINALHAVMFSHVKFTYVTVIKMLKWYYNAVNALLCIQRQTIVIHARPLWTGLMLSTLGLALNRNTRCWIWMDIRLVGPNRAFLGHRVTSFHNRYLQEMKKNR